MATVARPSELRLVWQAPARAWRWSPARDVVEIPFDLQPEALSVGGVHPIRDPGATLDTNGVEFAEAQESLDFDAFKRVGKVVLDSVRA